MAGPEATIERAVCARALTEYGVENIKLKDVRGWPDRLFLIPGGRPLLIEFKSPGEKPRPLQAHVHNKLRKLGYEIQVHDNVERALQAITRRLEAAQLPKEKH